MHNHDIATYNHGLEQLTSFSVLDVRFEQSGDTVHGSERVFHFLADCRGQTLHTLAELEGVGELHEVSQVLQEHHPALAVVVVNFLLVDGDDFFAQIKLHVFAERLPDAGLRHRNIGLFFLLVLCFEKPTPDLVML